LESVLDYAWLKSAHRLLALISLSGFILRWCWRQWSLRSFQTHLTKSLPHVVDTLFLFSGLTLAWQATLLLHPPTWLLAKVIGLLGYIILGMVAMRSTVRSLRSILAFVAASLCFLWIVSVAILKSPAGIWLALV